jgi:hypothetical protein
LNADQVCVRAAADIAACRTTTGDQAHPPSANVRPRRLAVSVRYLGGRVGLWVCVAASLRRYVARLGASLHHRVDAALRRCVAAAQWPLRRLATGAPLGTPGQPHSLAGSYSRHASRSYADVPVRVLGTWVHGCLHADAASIAFTSRVPFLLCCCDAGSRRCSLCCHSPLRCLAASLRRRADTSLRCCHTQPLRCLAVALRHLRAVELVQYARRFGASSWRRGVIVRCVAASLHPALLV